VSIIHPIARFGAWHESGVGRPGPSTITSQTPPLAHAQRCGAQIKLFLLTCATSRLMLVNKTIGRTPRPINLTFQSSGAHWLKCMVEELLAHHVREIGLL